MKHPFAILLLILMAVSLASAGKLLPPGTEAKKFLNLNLQNQHVGLRDYVGTSATKKVKSVVLSFWSTTCIPCRKEMPLVQSWYDANKANAELFFINLDKKSDLSLVQEYVAQNKVTGPVLLDFYQTTAKAYGVCEGNNCSIPALFVIDATTGIIQLAVTGFEEGHDLGATLTQAAFAPKYGAPKTASATSSLDPKTKLNVLHSVLVSLPHDEYAQKNGLTREQLIDLLKEAESAAKKQWGL